MVLTYKPETNRKGHKRKDIRGKESKIHNNLCSSWMTTTMMARVYYDLRSSRDGIDDLVQAYVNKHNKKSITSHFGNIEWWKSRVATFSSWYEYNVDCLAIFANILILVFNTFFVHKVFRIQYQWIYAKSSKQKDIEFSKKIDLMHTD